MKISKILQKEYKLCDFEEREKSPRYKEIDLDELIVRGLDIEEDNVIEIIDPDITSKLV